MTNSCEYHSGSKFYVDYYANHAACEYCAQVRDAIALRLVLVGSDKSEPRQDESWLDEEEAR